MNLDHFHRLAATLQAAAHVPCTVEFPGAIHFADLDGLYYVLGTDTEARTWSADVYASAAALADGANPVGSVETTAAEDAAPELVAAAILETLFPAFAARDALARWYVEAIGYDPFADDPAATESEVRATVREYLIETKGVA